jgi:uncharacterized membrane protein YgaE (UPF0421/DUF939 family)
MVLATILVGAQTLATALGISVTLLLTSLFGSARKQTSQTLAET